MEFTVYQHDISGHLFYITHIDNIPSIIKNGILSHDYIISKNLSYTSIYDKAIVNTRKEKQVNNGKTLWHYANLYFQPRNPMLYRVTMEKSLNEIVIIAVRKNVLETPGAYITDGNAASVNTKFYRKENYDIIKNQIKEMTELEWWSKYNSTKRKIMLECLIPNQVLPECIEAIYVSNTATAKKVRSSVSSDVNVIREPRMFFEPAMKKDLTSNLSLVEGDLFFSKMQTLTVSVNCMGIMGKGLASRAKYQFPDVYVHYQDKCKKKILKMGKPVLYRPEGSRHEEIADISPTLPSTVNDTMFLLFPTKQDWRDKSDLTGIEQGLHWLVDNYKNFNITSLAIPALGCGLGRLDWKDVGPILCRNLALMDIPVWVYLPAEKNISEEFLTPEFLLKESSI